MEELSQLDKYLNTSDSMPHAFLLIGHADAAMELAKDFSLKVTGQKFPNIDTVQYDAGTENITDVREVIHIASLKPLVATKKIVLLSNMDQASHQILNAILKTLEESPSGALFILLSTRALLPTVMSRCQVVNVYSGQRLDPPEVEEALGMLTSARTKGLAERMSMITKLAELEEWE